MTSNPYLPLLSLLEFSNPPGAWALRWTKRKPCSSWRIRGRLSLQKMMWWSTSPGAFSVIG